MELVSRPTSRARSLPEWEMILSTLTDASKALDMGTLSDPETKVVPAVINRHSRRAREAGVRLCYRRVIVAGEVAPEKHLLIWVEPKNGHAAAQDGPSDAAETATTDRPARRPRSPRRAPARRAATRSRVHVVAEPDAMASDEPADL